MIGTTGRIIIQVIILIGRFLLGRSGRRGSAVNVDPKNT